MRANNSRMAGLGGHDSTGPEGDGCSCQSLSGPVEFSMPTPPSTNKLYRNLPGRGRVKTAVYHDFIARGITAIRQQKVEHIPGNIIIMMGIERMSKTADIDNRIKSLVDTIVKAKVIEDDNKMVAVLAVWMPKANGLSWVKIFPEQKFTVAFRPSPEGGCGGLVLTAPLIGE